MSSEGNDIIEDTERAFKLMLNLWDEKVKERVKSKSPLSYQRFKVLRAIMRGAEIVPDIADEAGLSETPAWEALRHLKDSKHVVREPINLRTFKWIVTKRGKTEFKKMNKLLTELAPDLRKIAKRKLDIWL